MKLNWNDLMRRAIRESRLSIYALAKQANVGVAPIQRFVSGDHGITLTTAEKLAAVLGVELRIKQRKGR